MSALPAAVLLLGAAVLVGAVGVAVGMLLAPSIGRLAERLERPDDENEDERDV